MPTVAQYFDSLSSSKRTELKKIWNTAKSLAPDTEEKISYGMPALVYKGKLLVAFASNKAHIGLYPYGNAVMEILKTELKNFKTTKGSIHITAESPMPKKLLAKIIGLRKKLINEALKK